MKLKQGKAWQLGTMLLVAILALASCGNPKPEDVVSGAMTAMQQENYSELANYLYLDTLPALNESERDEFATYLAEIRKDASKIKSFEVQSFPSSTDSVGPFCVKMTYTDGVNEMQMGELKQNRDGKWSINVMIDSISKMPETHMLYGKDIKVALMKVLAGRSIPQYLFDLGLLYFDSPQLKKDTIQAVKLIKAASDAGYTPAQGRYGEYLIYGSHGVTQDQKKGIALVEKAVEKEDAYSLGVLGRCYIDGVGVDVDYKRGYEYCLKAHEEGDSDGTFLIGWCYHNGKGTTKDVTKALDYYEKAIQQNHRAALYNLGILYYDGNGIPRDYKKAVEYYLQAANQGHVSAMVNLGYCYYHGQGVKQDKNEAYRWYKKAADLGNAKAIQYINSL